MKVLVYGSINYDYVYHVDHIAHEGETVPCTNLTVHFGGKGLNQSIALARAGAEAHLAGMVGEDGEELLAACRKNGVIDHVAVILGRTGHAMIQLDAEGENCIIGYGGANRQQTTEYIHKTLDQFDAGDFLVLQNEINRLAEMIDYGYERGMRIILNPSPYDSFIEACDFGKLSILIINEVEGKQITGREAPEEILAVLAERYPQLEVVLTLGGDGAMCSKGGEILSQPAYPTTVVDTTGAGDTFAGYYTAALVSGLTEAEALKIACRAGAAACSKEGAVDGIPWMNEL